MEEIEIVSVGIDEKQAIVEEEVMKDTFTSNPGVDGKVGTSMQK